MLSILDTEWLTITIDPSIYEHLFIQPVMTDSSLMGFPLTGDLHSTQNLWPHGNCALCPVPVINASVSYSLH